MSDRVLVSPAPHVSFALDFADEQQLWADASGRTPSPTGQDCPAAMPPRLSVGPRTGSSPGPAAPQEPLGNPRRPLAWRARSSPPDLPADAIASMASFEARLRNLLQCTFAGASCLVGARAAAGLPFYGAMALLPAAVAAAGALLGRKATRFDADSITLAAPGDWGRFFTWQAGLGAAAAFVSMAIVGLPMSSAWLQAGAAVVGGQALGRAALVLHPSGFPRQSHGLLGAARQAGHTACIGGGIVLCAASLYPPLAAARWLWPLYLGSSAGRAFLEAAEPTGADGASALGRRVNAHVRLERARACPAALVAIIFGTAVAAAPCLPSAERLAVRAHMAGLGLAMMLWP